MKRIPSLLSIFFVLPVAVPARAQAVCRPSAGTVTTVMLATCLAKVQEQLDSVLAVEHQIRLTLEDINRKLPSGGRTVQEYVDSALAAVGTGSRSGSRVVIGNRVQGDLIVTGRLVVGADDFSAITPEARDAVAQFISPSGVKLWLEGNRNGAGPQLAGHVSTGFIEMNGGDGGLRFLQNWTGGGEHNGLSVDSIRPNSSFGFDSQGTLTGGRRYVGQQTYGSDWWLFDDVRNGVVQLTSPQPGLKVQICQTAAGAPYAYSSDCR
jgi:hypothetical protein